MAANQKIERLAQAVMEALNYRLATSTYPVPVTRAYDGNKDLYLSVTVSAGPNNAVDAIIKFVPEAAPASGLVDGLGLAQTVYTPHKTQVAFDSTAAVGTAESVKFQVLCEVSKLGTKVEEYIKAVGAANLAVADIAAGNFVASYSNLEFGSMAHS